MNEGRRRRRAKQARRDARRMKARDAKPPDEERMLNLLRRAMAKRHPLNLLAVVSILLRIAAPDPRASPTARARTSATMDSAITYFIQLKCRETSALLAVLAEMMVDEPACQERCRQEFAARNDRLPPWISALPDIAISRVVRATREFGDEDEVLIGVRLAGRYDMTCLVHFNHNMFSDIDDADVLPESVDAVLASVHERDAHSDCRLVDMSLADAGAWIRHGLNQPMFYRESDSWPTSLPVVRWLAAHMPEGGTKYQKPEWDWSALKELARSFFASRAGSPFRDVDTEEVLLELVESGNGDPLRWSPARIAQVLRGVPLYGDHTPLASVLDVPDLLRAFVPFAHARSGIRDELTAETIAVIDEMGPAYRREVLAKSDYWE